MFIAEEKAVDTLKAFDKIEVIIETGHLLLCLRLPLAP